MKTRTTLILTFTIIITFVAGSTFGAYSGGTGDPNDPYQIASAIDLLTLAADTNDYNECFILTADINMGGQVFTTAIIAANTSSSSPAFTGTFDGNGHKITGFTINGGSNSYLGLFGQISSGGSVKNLGLENFVVISGSSYVGGLVGGNNGSISNCYSTGVVNGSGNFVGGLVGYNDGSISNCYSRGMVSASSYVGGLVGFNDGNISNCYSTGEVNGSGGFVGGLVGSSEGGGISNCYSTGEVNGSGGCVGGLVGENDGSIDSCYSTCAVSGSSGSSYVGGLVGWNSNYISNCYSTGTVSGSSYVGGLVGYNDGSISNCHSTGEVNGSGDYVGGLVGENDGSIGICYSTCAVSGSSYVGGLVGENDDSISSCYSTGAVSGSSYVGGLVGENDDSISSCYSTGSVSGSSGSSYVGGLVGSSDDGSVVSSFWDINTSGLTTSAGGAGMTTAQMKTKSTFTDAWWDFSFIWDIVEGQTYPFFKSGVGTGTPDDPYRIATKADLLAMAADNSECFILTADINMGGQVFTTAIIAADGFSGTFDGNDHKITNFTIKGGNNSYLGLFGQISSGGSVKNLGLENFVVVSGSYCVGGLVGENDGSISNCYSTGEVNGSGSFVGGLVGLNYSSSISNCYSTGAVIGGDSNSYYVGGLVGLNYSSSIISNCYSTGTVSGGSNSYYVGGLVGLNYDGSISNCYSTSSVSGSSGSYCVGGLVGYNYDGNISNCYSTGSVSSSSYVGGLVGYNYDGSVVGSFWDINTSGLTTSAGGTGMMTAQMKTLSTFTSAGWDFTTIWAICEGTNYPRLVWQIPAGDWVCPDGVGFADFAYFAEWWQTTGCDSSNNFCGGADMDSSGTVDMQDLEIFVASWLSGE